MPTDLPLRIHHPAKGDLGHALIALLFATVAVICGALVVFGPQIRAAGEAEQVRIVGEEDRTFCTTFGVGPETGRYGECAAALQAIRTRHEERVLAGAGGIL